MTATYVFCFLGGGLLILLAIFSSDAGDLDSVPDSAEADLADLPLSDLPLGLLLSTRFWSFGLCFFGLSGLLLQLIVPGLYGLFSIVLAGATGLVIGFLAYKAMTSLSRRDVDSLVRQNDLIGQIGTVKLPMEAGQRGSVELQVKGSLIRRTAFSLSGPLQIGDQIVLISISANNLKVMHADQLTNHDSTVN